MDPNTLFVDPTNILESQADLKKIYQGNFSIGSSGGNVKEGKTIDLVPSNSAPTFEEVLNTLTMPKESGSLAISKGFGNQSSLN